MQESGELSRMKIKWWREKRGGKLLIFELENSD